MPTQQPATTIRLNDEDKKILEKLKKKTGLDSVTAIIKMAIRSLVETPTEDELLAKFEMIAANVRAERADRRTRGAPTRGARQKGGK